MPRLPDALRTWPGNNFPDVLKREIERLGATALPLAQATTPSSYLTNAPISVSVRQVTDTGTAIEANLGIFFTEIAASCGCGAEPMEHPGYCELRVRIDKATAEATFTPIVH